MSSLMESHLIASINEHLSLHLTQNSIFLAERLVAQFPREENFLLLATCYHRSGETFRAYHLLKGAIVMVISLLHRCTVCIEYHFFMVYFSLIH